jgi:hypothetical protein
MPAIRDWTYNYGTTTTATTIAAVLPQYQQYDLLLAVLTTDTGTTQVWSCTGWTQLLSASNTVNLGVMWKLAGASETDPTFTYTIAETANVTLFSIRDVHQTTPIANSATANLAAARQAMPTTTATANNSLIIYCGAHASTAVCTSVIEGPITQVVAKDGSAHGDFVAWGFQKASGTTFSNVYTTVVGTTYTGILGVIAISPPAGGATVFPPYCVSDASTYVDPIHGVTAFNGNTAFAGTALTYFGSRLKGTAVANTTTSAKADYGINSFRSAGGWTGPTTANTWQAGTTVLSDANRVNVTDKNVLFHLMPLIPADLQTVYDVALGKGNAIGMWSPNTTIDTALVYNANTTTYTDVTTAINNTTANDVSLPPFQITTIGDAFYIGRNTTFDTFTITIGTAGVYTGGTLRWEYYNGAAWAAITVVIDPTAFLKSAVTSSTVMVTIPGDWATYSVFTITKYWLRCVITANPSARTSSPLATQAWHTNYRVWHVHGFNTPWVEKRASCVVHVDNTAGLIEKHEVSFDKTLIKGLGFFTCGFLVSSDWTVTQVWILNTTVIAGGFSTEPIEIPGIVSAASAGFERLSVIQQAAAQMLIVQPLQFGDGATNPIYMDLNATATEFPSLYNKTTRQVYYCSMENIAGITYYAGTGDTIKHRNSIISSPSKYHWKFHASSASSANATYDFSGLQVIGAGTIVLNSGVNLSTVVFSECSKITAVGNILNGCTINGGTDTTALEVSAVAQVDDKIINCKFTNNVRAINITTAGTYKFSNLTFSGNTYDIENSSAGAVTINCENGANPTTYINTGGGSTSIVNTKTLTITCKNESGLAIAGIKVRIEKTSDKTLVCEGSTNSSGIYTFSYSYGGDLSVKVIARLKGYKNAAALDTITTNGLSVPFTLIKDAAVDLP